MNEERGTVRDFSLKQLAERLRLAREHAGLTQREFAAGVGYSRRQVIAWERAQNVPPVQIFTRLRSVCNVDPEWVLTGPGLEPLEEVTPEVRDREKRAVRSVDDLAKSYGLELPQEALAELAAILLRAPEGEEYEALESMRAYIGPLSRRTP